MNDVYIAWLLLLCVLNIGIAQYPSPNWQNVAVYKRCNMSSSYGGDGFDNSCSTVINGNTGTTYVNGNCIHTAVTDQTPTWTVDLGENYTVRGIRIYARAGYDSLKRMGYVQVTVDSTDVYTFPSFTTANTWNTTNIQQNTPGSSLPKTGRYIKLWKNTASPNDNKNILLNICEVEVWVCSPGYYGQNCVQCKSECTGLPCDDINNPNTCSSPCNPNPCQHGGTCQRGTGNNVDTYTCQCDGTGYQGLTCQQDIDECAGTSNPCHNGGTCANTDGSYNCTCTVGYTGKQCDDDINECAGNPNPCHNGGTCANTRGSYTCTCAVGYTGKQCDGDINECAGNSNPCLNGGTCANTRGSYTCTCAVGYAGTHCDVDIDECPLITCDHGGTCMNTPGSYNCVCSIGYTGKNCETDINYCSPNPCLHGRCNDLKTRYTCDCEPGYTDITCSTDIDDCVSGPCINGTCSDRVNSFVCTCYAGYEGNTCEKVTDKSSTISSEPVSAGLVAGVAVGGMVLGAAILGVVGFLWLRRRSRGAQDSPTRRHRDGSKVTRDGNSRTSSTAADYEDVIGNTGPRQQEEPAVEYYSSANPDQVHLSPTKGKNRVTKRASPAIGALDEGATANSPYYNTALDGSDEGFPSQTAATSSSPSATAAAAESNYEDFVARGIYDRPEMYENRMEHHVYTGLKKK